MAEIVRRQGRRDLRDSGRDYREREAAKQTRRLSRVEGRAVRGV